MKQLTRNVRSRSFMIVLLLCIVAITASLTLAQRGRGRRWRQFSDDGLIDRRGVPDWPIDPKYPHDTFTFVRLRYNSDGWGRGGGWQTDYPDSDLNFSLRLQQLTSLKVNPNPIFLEITDERLAQYPFVYMIEPGALYFLEPEVAALRKYLLNGGFMMVDDFWGDEEYENFYEQMKRVFPEREPTEVPFSHEIFHLVYDLKEKPQIPAYNVAEWGQSRGITWEQRYGSDTSKPRYLQITDDDDRMMVFICHNTDLGDGWEREGENEWYFREFSVKKAYPMGINIVTYAMTH